MTYDEYLKEAELLESAFFDLLVINEIKESLTKYILSSGIDTNIDYPQAPEKPDYNNFLQYSKSKKIIGILLCLLIPLPIINLFIGFKVGNSMVENRAKAEYDKAMAEYSTRLDEYNEKLEKRRISIENNRRKENSFRKLQARVMSLVSSVESIYTRLLTSGIYSEGLQQIFFPVNYPVFAYYYYLKKSVVTTPEQFIAEYQHKYKEVTYFDSSDIERVELLISKNRSYEEDDVLDDFRKSIMRSYLGQREGRHKAEEIIPIFDKAIRGYMDTDELYLEIRKLILVYNDRYEKHKKSFLKNDMLPISYM